MIEKIGKWSLIFGAIISLLLIMLGFIFKNIVSPFSGTIPYPLLTFVPLFSAVLCYLPAWLISKKSKTGNNMKEGNNMAIFFKTYLYLWPISTILIAVGGVIFLSIKVSYPESVFCMAMILAGLAWLTVLIVSILVWAAFNAWKSNEIVGVIIAIAAFAVFIGSGFFVGFLYANNAYENAYDEYAHQTYYGEESVALAEPYETETDGDYDDSDDYSESYEITDDYYRAYRFLTYRLNLDNASDPVGLLRLWKLYSWRRDGYDERSDIFGSYQDFQECFNSFYYIYDRSYNDNTELINISVYYENDLNETVSQDIFKKSGAKDLLSLLFLAHKDIYSKSDHEKISDEIYEIMCKKFSEADSDDVLVSVRYPDLTAYMSNETLKKMEKIIGSNEWENKLLAVWAYSFWARRHHDGVDETAYKILKTIDKLYNY